MYFTSTIIRGIGLGRKIGYPTINLAIPSSFSLIPGVYGCIVYINSYSYPGILYYGDRAIKRIQVDKQCKTLEIHLLDDFLTKRKLISGVLKNKRISVTTLAFIRPPKEISSLRVLQKEIKKDIGLLTEKRGKTGEK